MNDQEALLVLNAVPGLGNIRIRKLIEHFGSAAAVFATQDNRLRNAGVLSRIVADKIIEFDRDNFLQNEYNQIRKRRVEILTIFEDQYPAALKNIYDPPVVLYVKGCLPQVRFAVAVVGSRKASMYGVTVAEKFSAQLAELGLVVVSGLAKGIDAAAHRGCLKTGGQTVAVIGCGLNHIYPQENRHLYEEMGKRGAILSEFPMATPPISFNFPARNRIISGMSLAVLVIEASLKSGALITSRFALEQGRDVFAIPGKIDQPNSQGTNRLIKEGAKLVTCFEDILDELAPELRRNMNATQQSTIRNDEKQLAKEENDLLEYLNSVPLHFDDLLQKTGIPQGEVAEILLKLELKRVIKPLPGKYFIRS